MATHLTIPKDPARDSGLDHRQLYEQGLEHVRRLSRIVWNDFNVHDPGITTLELLCYAMTDLGYRASLPIQDILATETSNAQNMQSQFYSARSMLPNRALTVLDYRKLLIDIPGVKNGWLTPAKITYYADTIKEELSTQNSGGPGIRAVEISGVYDVTIEYMDHITSDADRKTVRDEVMQTLHENRNLCEDFKVAKKINTQMFMLCGEFELSSNADVVTVHAEILFQVQQYLSPSVARYSLSEMLARHHDDGTLNDASDIFDGPLLKHGFIDDGELVGADLRTEIRLSDIINIISDINGIRAVRDIVANPEGTLEPLENKWLVPVADGKKAALNNALSRLVFYKRNMPVVADPAAVQEHLDKLNAEATHSQQVEHVSDFSIPLGKHRKLDKYYSFQNHFPNVYGIGHAGLSPQSDPPRKAQAYQLKAYLLFFDQVMANYLAQLNQVKHLFSTDPDLDRTYFYQVVDSIGDYDKIYANSDMQAILQDQVDESSVHMDRRHRFLDHLIARFAESFTEVADAMYSAFQFSRESMARYKCEFLQSYSHTSCERSLGYNYTLNSLADLWDSHNISGLECRLAKLLGLRDSRRRNFGEFEYDAHAEVEEVAADTFRFHLRDAGNVPLWSSTANYATSSLAKKALGRAITTASLPPGYRTHPTADEQFDYTIVDGTEILARSSSKFASETDVAKAVDSALDYTRSNYSDEGMYVIESILLRPDDATDPMLPICTEPDCDECEGADPYSYRIHVILPAYGSRFHSMEFRRFTEEVIRTETPAHILPKVCWINQEDMKLLEKSYQDWIALKSQSDTSERLDKLEQFIADLFSVKNVYPSHQLHACDAAEDQPKFLLGRTTLGTIDGDDS